MARSCPFSMPTLFPIGRIAARRRRLVGAWGLCFGSAVAIALGLVACATGQMTPPKPARVQLVNQSDYGWRISAQSSAGGAPLIWLVAKRETRELTLPGGDYQIEQTMVSDPSAADAPRRFTCTLEAAQTYRWRLTTMLSAPEKP